MRLTTPGYREPEPVPDLPPLGTETELTELLAVERPRPFALCAEDDDRADGWIVAWRMTFDDRVEVVGVDGTMRAGLGERRGTGDEPRPSDG